MKQGKYEHSRKRRRSANKSVALLLALTLAVGCAIGGTIAWLTAESETVTNTFTDSDINITLTETTGNNYKMIPGWTIAKDPVVTLSANSEACYVFVKIDEDLGNWKDNKVKNSSDQEVDPKFTDYLSYDVADGWTAGDGKAVADGGNGIPVGVYYRKVDTDAAKNGAAWYVLAGEGTGANKNGFVTVSENVTKEMMDEIDETTDDKPTLTFQAAAVQLYKTNSDGNPDTTTDEFDVTDAYANVVWPTGSSAGSGN